VRWVSYSVASVGLLGSHQATFARTIFPMLPNGDGAVVYLAAISEELGNLIIDIANTHHMNGNRLDI
jgi:hypothetical protein